MNSNGREEKSKEEFSRIASNYEKGIWGMYFRFSYRQVLKKCRSYFKQNIKILDIGCGPGGLELLLTKFIRKCELLGLDISPQMIMTARQRVLDKNNKITFSVGRANKIPSPNSYFDIAFCLNTFHHLPEQKKFLLEINRVLKPEGIFVVLDVTSDTIIRKIWIKILNAVFREKGISEYISKKSFEKLFSETGFNILKEELFLFFTSLFIIKKNKNGN